MDQQTSSNLTVLLMCEGVLFIADDVCIVHLLSQMSTNDDILLCPHHRRCRGAAGHGVYPSVCPTTRQQKMAHVRPMVSLEY